LRGPERARGLRKNGAGYPAVSFWKEEAIFGNTFCAGQLDRNGSVYDFHFPTPGGVYGVGTRNEGYVDGVDTFPPGLPVAWRGQMHLNQAMAGVRVESHHALAEQPQRRFVLERRSGIPARHQHHADDAEPDRKRQQRRGPRRLTLPR